MSNFVKQALTLVDKSIKDLDLPVFEIGLGATKPKNPVILHANDQCIKSNMKDQTIYILTHNDIHIVDDLLSLTPYLKNKIQRVGQFTSGMYGEKSLFNQPSHKVVLFSNKDMIELTIIGTTLKFLLSADNINIKSNLVCEFGDFPFSDVSSLHRIIDECLDKLVADVLTITGFPNSTETSLEVLDFLNKSAVELLLPSLVNSRCSFVKPSEYLDALKIDWPDFVDIRMKDGKNKNIDDNFFPCVFKDDEQLIFISTFSQLIKDKKSHHKFEQLVGLMSFYSSLLDRPLSFQTNFFGVRKPTFFANKSCEHAFYSFTLSDLTLSVGHNIVSGEFNDGIAVYDVKEDNETYNYSFNFTVGKKKDYGTTVEHLTNDLDYVYNFVLEAIKKHINQSISNVDGVINKEHIEVFKMLTF
jgi:hypothetical protein